MVIAKQFGLSRELDAFNAANNLPDLLFALISGGALAIAFIPVLSETLDREGRQAAWKLFSRIANLAVLITAGLGLFVAIFADQMVRWRVGIAPGFGAEQQHLVATLMRLNLVSTLIFSVSGLVMAGLQANQHFLLPAMAPMFYNVGQIFGAVVLSPAEGYQIGGMTLPAFGLGVHGLVYGVVLGAALHLAIQLPGLLHFGFRWAPALGIRTPAVQKVLRVMGPRVITMFLIQLTFIARDNLASQLQAGAVTALTYGYMIMQVPETLIGTAIGTALLPSLSELISRNQREAFRETIQRAVRVLLAVTLPVAVVLSIGLRPLIAAAFGFDAQGTELTLWVARGFLLGLMGQSILEVAARSFYAQQDARTPLMAAAINLGAYILLGSALFRPLGAAGISLGDSLAFTSEAALLIWLLNRRLDAPITLGSTAWRAFLAGVIGGLATYGVMLLANGFVSALLASIAGMAAGVIGALPFIWVEIRQLLRL